MACGVWLHDVVNEKAVGNYQSKGMKQNFAYQIFLFVTCLNTGNHIRCNMHNVETNLSRTSIVFLLRNILKFC